jgi:hypothetical protein
MAWQTREKGAHCLKNAAQRLRRQHTQQTRSAKVSCSNKEMPKPETKTITRRRHDGRVIVILRPAVAGANAQGLPPVARSLTRTWPDTISQAAAFLCGVAFFRAKFDAGRSMLFVQL